jgi:hypothetical protein
MGNAPETWDISRRKVGVGLRLITLSYRGGGSKRAGKGERQKGEGLAAREKPAPGHCMPWPYRHYPFDGKGVLFPLTENGKQQTVLNHLDA